MVSAVTTRESRSVANRCSSSWDPTIAVTFSVSAAVPAPQHQMLGAM